MTSVYDRLYRWGLTPWERAAELQQHLVARLLDREEATHPGRGVALDLGCGTGVHTVALAQRGWQAWGVDSSTEAIARARRRAARAAASVRFDVGDVRDLGRLPPPASPVALVIDVGCYHGVAPADRPRVAAGVTALAGPGSTMLVVGMGRRPGRFPVGVTADEFRRLWPGWQVLDSEPLDLRELGGLVGRVRWAIHRLVRG